MKDKDGFVIRCKHSEWVEENGEDFCACKKYRCTGWHECYADELCGGYEPKWKENDDDGN